MQKRRLMLQGLNNNDWTLFLDRDGVINKRIIDGYVTRMEDFELLPGAAEAIAKLSKKFKTVVVVTNQRGIARGLYTMETVRGIHNVIQQNVEASGGRIDGFYVCPHDYADKCDCRKPATGLAYQAKADFPWIDFSKSVMAGDSISDIEFGQSLGMKLVWVGEDVPPVPVDLHINTLSELSDCISKAIF